MCSAKQVETTTLETCTPPHEKATRVACFYMGTTHVCLWTLRRSTAHCKSVFMSGPPTHTCQNAKQDRSKCGNMHSVSSGTHCSPVGPNPCIIADFMHRRFRCASQALKRGKGHGCHEFTCQRPPLMLHVSQQAAVVPKRWDSVILHRPICRFSQTAR